MEAPSVERKLAAIFAADVAGYSALMGRDEVVGQLKPALPRPAIPPISGGDFGGVTRTAGSGRYTGEIAAPAHRPEIAPVSLVGYATAHQSDASSITTNAPVGR